MIRTALPVDYELLTELYRSWGYRAGIAQSDVVYVAEYAGQRVGLVRRTFENDVTMLRGMQIDPAYRRQGIGSRLLDAFVADVRDQQSFCIPFAHLTEFYARGGFRTIAEEEAPHFLAERLDHYRREGHNVLLMRRPGDTHLDRAG
jgi:N-acetylglutamate synthase-like GNAT family acetyltransferase